MDLAPTPQNSSPGQSREVSFRRRSSSGLIHSDLQMTTCNRVSAGQKPRDYRSPAFPVQRLAPPPLAPYVRPEQRFFPPFPENIRGTDSRQGSGPRASGNPSVPPSQRPAPSYLPPPPSRFHRPLSPPSSRGRSIASQRADQAYFAAHAKEMSRSQSHSSQQSTFSAPSGYVSRPPSSGSGDGVARGEQGRGMHATSEPAPEAAVPLQRQKPNRSRVFMTDPQQQRLSVLWKGVRSELSCPRTS